MEIERRKQRSQNTTMALCLQLDASRRAANLTGMVLSDADGLTLATAGDVRACKEVAARLATIGRKAGHFEGVLYSSDVGWEVGVERFQVADNELYLCAIGGASKHRAHQIHHSISGVTRILESARA
jgi:hypothetical protein